MKENFGEALLKQFGLRFEDLNSVERESFFNLVESVKTNDLTLDKLKDRIEMMRESVIMEVSNYKNGSTQDIYCKARIRNYTLIIGILGGQERAQKALEQALSNIKK